MQISTKCWISERLCCCPRTICKNQRVTCNFIIYPHSMVKEFACHFVQMENNELLDLICKIFLIRNAGFLSSCLHFSNGPYILLLAVKLRSYKNWKTVLIIFHLIKQTSKVKASRDSLLTCFEPSIGDLQIVCYDQPRNKPVKPGVVIY